MRAYMKNDILNSSYQTQRAETVVFAILGLVGLFAIGLALLASSEFVREKDRVVPARSDNSRTNGYFSSGQCCADGRTWAAMIRYLFEPVSDPLTSKGRWNQDTSVGIQCPARTRCEPLRREEVVKELKDDGRTVVISHETIINYKFTNELGQPVSLGDFRGQALAITFFFTRCPIPDYCPRLSRNFQEASSKLVSLPGARTNWHFLSVSFDTEFDNPPVLKAYGEAYHYNPAHWSFLTGAADMVGELARLSDVKVEHDAGSLNHNFRTLIIDAAGRLQMVFPTGGDLSGAIADEILKAAAVTN